MRMSQAQSEKLPGILFVCHNWYVKGMKYAERKKSKSKKPRESWWEYRDEVLRREKSKKCEEQKFMSSILKPPLKSLSEIFLPHPNRWPINP